MGYKFTVPGRPRPAVRMTQKSKWVNPKAMEYLQYKEKVGWTAKAAGVKPIEGPVELKLTFYLVKSGRYPDLNNMVKAVEDALNGIAYRDDRQVAKSTERRVWVKSRKDERVEIEIQEGSDEYV